MANPDSLRLAIIVGSGRAGRFGPTVAHWFATQARQYDAFAVDLVDLAGFNFPIDMASSPHVDEFARRIDTADVVVVVAPEYNHSFSGPLKIAIDSLKEPWKAKPIGLVSYGGISGGLRAAEALRLVFAELHAMTICETVSFHRARSQFDADGQPLDPDGPNAAARTLLDQLEWWASALTRARIERPYGQKVAVQAIPLLHPTREYTCSSTSGGSGPKSPGVSAA